MKKGKSIQRQRGVALISVMLIIALMTIVASNMTFTFNLSVNRISQALNIQQAKWFGYAGEALALKVLGDSLKDDDIVHLGQFWAQKETVFPIEDGLVAGEMKDMRSCFNLNAMDVANGENGQPPRIVEQFRALMEALEIDSFLAEQIADAQRDWIDADSSMVSSLGAEDATYEAMTPGYLAANQPMIDVSEFRQLNEVGPALFRRVAPYICTIPDSDWSLNVNTVDLEQPQILMAMFHPNLSEDTALSLLSSRPQSGWSSVENFLAEPELQGVQLTEADKGQLRVDSDYFRVEVKAQYDQSVQRMVSYIRVDSERRPAVYYRRYGGLN